MKNILCIVVLIAIVSLSCRSSVKKDILGIDSMKVVMWDMIKIDELYLKISTKDSTAKNRKENIRLYEEVLALHKITKGKFDSSYKFYEAHPVQFKVLVDSLEAFSSREKNLLPKPGQAH